MQQGNWHAIEVNTVLTQLNSSKNGLSTTQVAQRLVQHGHNSLPEQHRRSLLMMLIKQFSDFMIIVLLAAALVSGLVGEPQDTIVILVIVFLNALIGGIQEFRAENAIAALRKMASPEAHVLRDGHATTIAVAQLVPGDIVILDAGNIVPADLRLIDAEQLLIDESSLTGESNPAEKHNAVINEQGLSLGDQNNLAFKTSIVTRGNATGVVVATGINTQIGHIAKLLLGETTTKTPLQRRLIRFSRYLAAAILVICAVVFTAGLLQGQPILLMFMTAVSLAVAAIPEALPAVVSISLALGARKLIQHHALVRNLPAVETLGSVTYICSDKTGTLTQNQMTAELFYLAGQQYTSLTDNNLGLVGSHFGQAMALNNDITVRDGKATGEATELALFEAAENNGFVKVELEKSMPRVATVAFDNVRKRMSTLHTTNQDSINTTQNLTNNSIVAYVKGAPEQILSQCQQTTNTNSNHAVEIEAALNQASTLASEGYRVLALAMTELTQLPDHVSSDTIEHNLHFLGLVALIDPLRVEVPQAVNDCLAAGITPVMITGDHPNTALAIAKRLGITTSSETTISGHALAKLDNKQLNEQVKKLRVYARVTPEQKLNIVQVLQDQGEFVAMTGDGVNDAPALKRANIGVAMGQKGTDVARQASDMVLLDDNFATIVHAVGTGRRIFDNIRKFIKYTMSSNAGEVWTLLLAPLMGLPIALLPIHILWINLVTDGLPGLALTLEPAEANSMQRPPRAPEENIFAHGMWQHILWVGLLIGGLSIAVMAWGIARNVSYWQTMAFTVLTLSQLFHCLAIRSEQTSLFTLGILSNPALLAAVTLTFLLQMALIYVPTLNTLFHTQALPMLDLVVCILTSSLVLVAVEIEKLLQRRGIIYNPKCTLN